MWRSQAKGARQRRWSRPLRLMMARLDMVCVKCLRGDATAAGYRLILVVLCQVHAGVHAGDLTAVTIEHERGDGTRQKSGIDAALVRLGPAGVVVVGVDVGEEAVLHAVGVVPCGAGLLVGEVEADDGLCRLEAILPGHDNADGSAVLIGKRLAVTTEGEKSERVHRFVHAQAFFVWPVVA